MIFNARQSVKNEIASSVHLAVQLVESEIRRDKPGARSPNDWLDYLRNLGRSRHLKIHIQPLTEVPGVRGKGTAVEAVTGVPAWFVWSVIPEPVTVIKDLKIPNGQTMQLTIEAEPRDEIVEAWGEAVDLLGLVAVMASVVYGLVSIIVERAFKPVTVILDGLERLKTGRYQERLPVFSLPEFRRIASAINHTANALETASRDNDSLRQHSLAVREQERQYLTQELHDEFGQSLSAIKVVAASLRNQDLDKESLAAVDSILVTCNHLFSVLGNMMRRLHPLILDEFGLKASLEDMLEVWSAQPPQVKLSYELDDAVDDYSPDKQIHVFRIVQECLTNILKHAGATQVSVRIEIISDEMLMAKVSRLELQVSDNGSGFDPKAVKSGFGLRGIRERVKGLGGKLAIDSTAGKGVQIKIEVPFPRVGE